ncbi:hypothetical protein Nmel_017172 [Mimus melanotis]
MLKTVLIIGVTVWCVMFKAVTIFALQEGSSGHSCSLNLPCPAGGWIMPCVSFPGRLGHTGTQETPQLGQSHLCQQVTELSPSSRAWVRAVLKTPLSICCLCLGGWTHRGRYIGTAWSPSSSSVPQHQPPSLGLILCLKHVLTLGQLAQCSS